MITGKYEGYYTGNFSEDVFEISAQLRIGEKSMVGVSEASGSIFLKSKLHQHGGLGLLYLQNTAPEIVEKLYKEVMF